MLGRYAANRNRVGPGHTGVSRLSPALRHRLLQEEEVVAEVLKNFSFSTVEKFLQEIHWRTYWKGWLELHPNVWRDYIKRIAHLRKSLTSRDLERVNAVCEGKSGVAIMDRFARELTSTGYLHNHARMWWAGFWIHVEKLPWELGADFFYRHLLDADPASNTLSWRWVAGLQTPGKTYLPRRTNLEKYCDPEWLSDTTGLERLDDHGVKPLLLRETASLAIERLPELPSTPVCPSGRVGLWLHEDDGTAEMGGFSTTSPVAIAAFFPAASDNESSDMSALCQSHRTAVLKDSCGRAFQHFHCDTTFQEGVPLAESLAEWAATKKLDEVLAYAPFVGPLGDAIHEIQKALSDRGIRLSLFRRSWDAELFPAAKSGFFPFWEKIGGGLANNRKTN